MTPPPFLDLYAQFVLQKNKAKLWRSTVSVLDKTRETLSQKASRTLSPVFNFYYGLALQYDGWLDEAAQELLISFTNEPAFLSTYAQFILQYGDPAIRAPAITILNTVSETIHDNPALYQIHRAYTQ